jgi:hypothetical protein
MIESKNEAILIDRYLQLQLRASFVGINLQSTIEKFYFDDVPAARGRIVFNTLDSVEYFIYGYEMAYQITL